MEILFKNSYVRNKELAKEIYRYYYFQRKWLVACYVLLLLCFLGNILISIFERTYNWGVLVFIPLFFLFQFYCYFRQVNTMIKRDSEVHGKEISVETIVTNDYIQNTASTGAVNKLEYDKIRKVAQTKNSLKKLLLTMLGSIIMPKVEIRMELLLFIMPMESSNNYITIAFIERFRE